MVHIKVYKLATYNYINTMFFTRLQIIVQFDKITTDIIFINSNIGILNIYVIISDLNQGKMKLFNNYDPQTISLILENTPDKTPDTININIRADPINSR